MSGGWFIIQCSLIIDFSELQCPYEAETSGSVHSEHPGPQVRSVSTGIRPGDGPSESSQMAHADPRTPLSEMLRLICHQVCITGAHSTTQW